MVVDGGCRRFPPPSLTSGWQSMCWAAIRGMVGRPTDAERNLGIKFCFHAIGSYSSGMCQVGFKMKNPFDCVADSRLQRPPWAKITPPSPLISPAVFHQAWLSWAAWSHHLNTSSHVQRLLPTIAIPNTNFLGS